jgi:dCTP deaminase
MFLSGAWLADNAEPIISPFHKEKIDCSAYTMRVGYEAYVSPEANNEHRAPSIVQLNQRQPIVIPPGQFAFLITREYIRLPFDLFALINIKVA